MCIGLSEIYFFIFKTTYLDALRKKSYARKKTYNNEILTSYESH